MEKYSTFLVVMELQIKTTLRYYFMSKRRAGKKKKKAEILNSVNREDCCHGYDAQELSYLASGSMSWNNHWKTFWLQLQNTRTPYDPAVLC